MTTQPLLTISAFARAVDLAPSTLRHYDECGLLPPTEVDVRTGYRYYTPDLARRAHLVRRMREMGVPIDTMRQVLDGPAQQAAGLLRAYVERAAESARQVSTAMADVLAALHGDEWAAEHGAPAVELPVDGPQLGVALERVALAADPDPASPLGVVLLDVTDGDLSVVATNRYWLLAWTLPVEAEHESRRAVVPTSAVQDLAQWLARTDVVSMSVSGGQGVGLRFASAVEERAVATSEDRFPAYRMVLEGQAGERPVGRVTVSRDRLRDAVVRAGGPLRLTVGRDRLTVVAQGDVEGLHLDAVSVGEPLTLCFAPDLLGAALTAAVGSEVSFDYVAPDRPVRLSSPEHRALLGLLMPTLDEATDG